MMKMLLLSVITILVIIESSFMAQARPRDVVEAELATAVVGDIFRGSLVCCLCLKIFKAIINCWNRQPLALTGS